MITEFINKHKLQSEFCTTAEQYYVPLAETLRAHQLSAKETFVVGINGSQGSGKSTLSDFIRDYLHNKYGVTVVVMSLDDFYFSRAQRSILASNVHPLLQTRGVPGTHDMQQAKSVLKALKQNQMQVSIPRFNKATDDPFPESDWSLILPPVDLVIFEGWCWGAEAQTKQQLVTPINSLEQKEDPEGVWRQYSNQQLAEHYQPLYSLMDTWVMLKAPSFHHVYSWRLEQEQKLLQASSSKHNQGVMNEQQIQRFIQHYQRLTEHTLNTLPKKSDHVFELDSNRQILAYKAKA